MSFFDAIILAAYLILLVVIAWRARRQPVRDDVDYLLAGRKLTGPAFVMTLVSTWYGSILGVGEYSYRFGISNWLVFGVPYYLAAILFAIFLAGRARRSLFVSIPDQLEASYGRPAAMLGAAIVLIITVPAAYVLMLGELLQYMFGGSALVWMIVGATFSMLYVLNGGFRNVVRTDVPQFLLMFIGFFVLLIAAVSHSGGWEWLKTNLPDEHLSPTGGLGWAAIIVWYFIALQTMIEPTFYQRCYAARSEKVARWGLIVSVGFWLVFDFLTTFSGLYARAILGGEQEAMLSYPLLAQKLLPAGLLGLFFVSLLATIMSTVDSYMLLSAQTIGHDLWRRFKRESRGVRATRMGLILGGAAAVAIGAWKGSVISIFHDLGSIATPALLLPMIGALWRKEPYSARQVILSMLVSGGAALVWTFLGSYGAGYPFGVHPIYVGLALSALILLPPWRRRQHSH